MRISLEDFNSVTFEDIKDIIIDEELIKERFAKLNCSTLSKSQAATLILIIMKLAAVSYYLGTKHKEGLN